jgi:hypothetical protein
MQTVNCVARESRWLRRYKLWGPIFYSWSVWSGSKHRRWTGKWHAQSTTTRRCSNLSPYQLNEITFTAGDEVHVTNLAQRYFSAWAPTFQNFRGWSGLRYKFSRQTISKYSKCSRRQRVGTKDRRNDYKHSTKHILPVTVAVRSEAWVLAGWLLGSWVRIPLKAWLFVRVFLCCVVLCR